MHRVSDLRFALLDSMSSLGAVHILASREVHWNGDLVSFHVLAVSHAMILRCEPPLTELLTCGDFSPSGRPLAHVEVAAPYEFSTRLGHLDYRCRLDLFSLAAGDDLQGRFSPEQRLDVFFPSEGPTAPVTRIGWQIDRARLSVETVHSYPEQELGVRSRSRVEVCSGRG